MYRAADAGVHGAPARGREQTAAPKRSAFINLANGVHSLNYQITTPGKDYHFSRSLKPLEKHREVITPISGLHHPGALSHHHNCISIWLTGGKLGPSDRNTISVDQKMAELTAKHTRYPSIEIALTQDSLAWTADGVRLPACVAVAKSLVHSSKHPRMALRHNAKPCVAKRASWTLTWPKFADSNKPWLSRQGRLDQYLTSVREAEVRTRRADAWLDTPLPTVSEADRKRTNRDISRNYGRRIFPHGVRSHRAHAFQTDVTRIATFSMGGEGDAFSIPEIWHHRIATSAEPSRRRSMLHGEAHLVRYLRYRTIQLPFLTRLTQTKDLNGQPLLGTTMALFGSGMSYGHSHGNANLPLVLAGGSELD